MIRALRRKRQTTYILRPFEGDDRRWYWHARDISGHTVFTGGESYSDFTECQDAIGRVTRARLIAGGPRQPVPTSPKGTRT